MTEAREGLRQRISDPGIRADIVPLESVGYVFAAAAPTRTGDFEAQATEVLSRVKALAGRTPPFEVVRLTLFLKDCANRSRSHEIVETIFSEHSQDRSQGIVPATICITQPPCEGHEVVVEAWGVEKDAGPVEIEQHGSNVVVVRHGEARVLHFGEVGSNGRRGELYQESLQAFRSMGRDLESSGFRYDQVIRTWLYLGDIVGLEAGGLRYDALNRARSDFYRDIPFGKGLRLAGGEGPIFPGSTGIGTSERTIAMSCIALQAEQEEVLVVPLENPKQTPAFRYEDRTQKETPKFSRAVALATPNHVVTLVSGTASIVSSRSEHLDDAAAQTEQTLDNIEHLVSSENFDRYGIGPVSPSLADLSTARVYVKRPEDYEAIRRVCEDRLGEVPTLYAVADICRPELLVEIECVALSTRG